MELCHKLAQVVFHCIKRSEQGSRIGNTSFSRDVGHDTADKIEEMFDEIKTHLCDGKKVLRSKTSDLVSQEFYALTLTRAAIRRLMCEAARDSGQRPEDLSFVHAVRVLNRRLPEAAAISP